MTWMVSLTETDRRMCAPRGGEHKRVGPLRDDCWRWRYDGKTSGGNENEENKPDSGRKWMGFGAINSPEDGELIGGGFEQWVGRTAAN
ncbi:UNVERIFIED_CONTAM: hypothetical protein Sangu_2821500 [Sesamum angustifolium]|uniref:Uncharacterized protein n=1 Tax=Sesamum angustifolium TaxID=2727405 RepID=A0AAW2IR06_9LAMI